MQAVLSNPESCKNCVGFFSFPREIIWKTAEQQTAQIRLRQLNSHVTHLVTFQLAWSISSMEKWPGGLFLFLIALWLKWNQVGCLYLMPLIFTVELGLAENDCRVSKAMAGGVYSWLHSMPTNPGRGHHIYDEKMHLNQYIAVCSATSVESCLCQSPPRASARGRPRRWAEKRIDKSLDFTINWLKMLSRFRKVTSGINIGLDRKSVV